LSNITLGQEMTALDVGRAQSITGVLLHTAQGDSGNTDYFAGSRSGIVLEATVPNASQSQAQAILDRVSLRGYKYQPFDSRQTVTDPAIEIGDYVNANGSDGIVLGYDITHNRLMTPTLKAPMDEEINHEFTFQTRQQREYKRETKFTRSRLTINANAITAEVARATKREGELSSQLSITANAIESEVLRANNAEGVLRSSIAQTASDITAKVSKESGTQSTFGWNLTDHDWSIFANGTTVLRATINGLDVEGRITATSGYIGTSSSGFEIGNKSISNGMTSLDDAVNNGVYVGTDGIALGAGKFKVTRAGAVTATNLALTGGSISLGDDGEGNPIFRVTNQGVMTMKRGSISLGDDGEGNPVFRVTNTGAVTASNLSLTGGSISIKDGDGNVAFSVSSTGNLTANRGTFSGTVYAGNISIGGGAAGSDGTMNGNRISGGSVSTTQTSTGINTSLGYADFAAGVFSGTQSASCVVINGSQYLGGTISFIDGNGNTRTFYVLKMAGT
jgi:hypothetical protein